MLLMVMSKQTVYYLFEVSNFFFVIEASIFIRENEYNHLVSMWTSTSELSIVCQWN